MWALLHRAMRQWVRRIAGLLSGLPDAKGAVFHSGSQIRMQPLLKAARSAVSIDAEQKPCVVSRTLRLSAAGRYVSLDSDAGPAGLLKIRCDHERTAPRGARVAFSSRQIPLALR